MPHNSLPDIATSLLFFDRIILRSLEKSFHRLSQQEIIQFRQTMYFFCLSKKQHIYFALHLILQSLQTSRSNGIESTKCEISIHLAMDQAVTLSENISRQMQIENG